MSNHAGESITFQIRVRVLESEEKELSLIDAIVCEKTVNMIDQDEYRCFIGNLSWSTSDRDLKEAFKKFDHLLDAKVVMDRSSGRSRGFGFVTFDDEKSMEDAIEAMNGIDLDGRPISVDKAQPNQGGGGGGRDRDGGRDLPAAVVGGDLAVTASNVESLDILLVNVHLEKGQEVVVGMVEEMTDMVVVAAAEAAMVLTVAEIVIVRVDGIGIPAVVVVREAIDVIAIAIVLVPMNALDYASKVWQVKKLDVAKQ
ncbi:unnamed protein product [Lactuca saligna]|uniref:RRM domain-containing protein n=1 Tax=Lactuca saligna TaxID=75948 RepID=A0AA35ZGG6_LACSI|nr:unnamed protein product [Lactuca saligna]